MQRRSRLHNYILYSSFKVLQEHGYPIPEGWRIATLKDGESKLMTVNDWMQEQEGRKPRVYISDTHDKNFWAMDEFGSKLSPEMLDEMTKYCKKLQSEGKIILAKIPPDGIWNKIKFWWNGGYKKLGEFKTLFYGQSK